MDVFYENERARIHLKGGGATRTGVYIKEISGLGLPEKEFGSAMYVNQPGRKVTDERDVERVITLSVDVFSREGRVEEAVRDLMEALYLPGTLIVLSGVLCRKIACRCTAVEHFKKQGRQIASLGLQFVCDCPYFTDKELQEETLCYREDLVSGSFTLPCVFTERENRLTVVNRGQIHAEPVLTIFNTGKAGEPTQEVAGIEILNHATEKKIHLTYATSPGEVITVSIPERSIISSVNGNLFSALAPGSFLSDFLLLPGGNDIEVSCLNSGETVTVGISFESRYIEAVV